jgi:hypothetical protein
MYNVFIYKGVFFLFVQLQLFNKYLLMCLFTNEVKSFEKKDYIDENFFK